MSEQYQVFEITCIIEAKRRLNELAAQGYELVALALPPEGSGVIYVMRLSSAVPECQQPVPGLAATMMQLDVRVKALENRLDALSYDHNNHRRHAGEELHDLWLKDIKLGARLDAVVGKLRELETALARYQDTHAEAHKYLEARAAELERRLAALEAGRGEGAHAD